MFKDKQTLSREMIIEVNNKKAGKTKAIGMPIKFSKSNADVKNGAPVFGEHSKEILIKFVILKITKDLFDKKIIM